MAGAVVSLLGKRAEARGGEACAMQDARNRVRCLPVALSA
jgi:hypothetical protein